MNERLLRIIECVQNGDNGMYLFKQPNLNIHSCDLIIKPIRSVLHRLRVIIETGCIPKVQIQFIGSQSQNWLDVIIGNSVDDIKTQIVELLDPKLCHYETPEPYIGYILTPLFCFDLNEVDLFCEKMYTSFGIDLNKENYKNIVVIEKIKNKQHTIARIQREIDNLQKEINNVNL